MVSLYLELSDMLRKTIIICSLFVLFWLLEGKRQSLVIVYALIKS